MTITIAGHAFDGPYSTPLPLRNEGGVYAVLCHQGKEPRVIDVGEADRVRDRVEKRGRTEDWSGCCNGPLRYAARYTPELDLEERRGLKRVLRSRFGDLPAKS